MNKPEFSDFYKFITSLGLLLIAFAFLLPWLFLRESFNSLVSVSDIATLTPTAQTFITYQQYASLWIIQNIKLLSIISAVLGLMLLFCGIILWFRKQRKLDTKEELETKKLLYETKKMEPEQIAEKWVGKTHTKEQLNIIENYIQIESSILINFRNAMVDQMFKQICK